VRRARDELDSLRFDARPRASHGFNARVGGALRTRRALTETARISQFIGAT
jgi:hypothetical protein